VLWDGTSEMTVYQHLVVDAFLLIVGWRPRLHGSTVELYRPRSTSLYYIQAYLGFLSLSCSFCH